MTVAALIFDFDGLLMDTETTLLDSWRWEWRRHGLELDAATFFADHGGDANEPRYAELAAAVGRGYDRTSSHELRMAYRAELNAALQPAPGIVAWLDRAAALGLRLAVASSSPAPHVRALLAQAGLLDRFEVLATGEEVDAHKPDPAVYLLALDRLGLPATGAVAFEDTPHGVTAAQAAGLRCVAVPNPYADHARFPHADLLLPTAKALPLDDALAALPDELTLARRRFPVGDRVRGRVSAVPWGPGRTGLFVDLGAGPDGFVDVLHLPEDDSRWPAVGHEAVFEILQHRPGQVRLLPLDPAVPPATRSGEEWAAIAGK
ncbi:HAD-IA family hydrolase [Actinoplanes sp. NPDC051494]|uniref:HAD-IA family hydrolase n=1 Tax=Actinoplanes sp. NPDC051494 TaxID=3363907 RepID=UPI0037ADA7F7